MKKALYLGVAAFLLISGFALNAPKAEACTMLGCGVYGSDHYVNWLGTNTPSYGSYPSYQQQYPSYQYSSPNYYMPQQQYYYPQQQWGYQPYSPYSSGYSGGMTDNSYYYPQQYSPYQSYLVEDQWYYEPYGRYNNYWY